MLTVKERHRVLKWFRHFSDFDLFPVQVDLQEWKVRPGCGTKAQSWASKAWYALFLAHSLYKTLNLLYTFCFLRGVPLHQMVIHGVLGSAAGIFAFWYYLLHIKYAGENTALIQITLTGGIIAGGREAAEARGASDKRGLKRLLEYTLQDLIAVSLPYMVLSCLPLIGASYIYDHEMRVLLYSALPECLKNRVSFWICFAEEMRLMLMFTGIVVPTWQLQVISFDLVNSYLESLAETVYTLRGFSIEAACKDLRCLQLYVTLLNTVHSNLIFMWKLLSIGLSIICGYAAIAHFHEYPVFGIMYYVIFIDMMLIYTVIYEKGFKVSDMFNRAKNMLRLRVSKHGNGVRGKTLNRQLMSIPAVGIKVGDFHMLERTSTPVFLHYVLTNIVNMLVAYA